MKVAKSGETTVVEVCPLCGSKLEKGYMASRMVAWSEKKISEESFSGMIMGGGFLTLIGTTIVGRYPYGIKNVEAYQCKKCKLVIFRYGEPNK